MVTRCEAMARASPSRRRPATKEASASTPQSPEGSEIARKLISPRTRFIHKTCAPGVPDAPRSRYEDVKAENPRTCVCLHGLRLGRSRTHTATNAHQCGRSSSAPTTRPVLRRDDVTDDTPCCARPRAS